MNRAKLTLVTGSKRSPSRLDWSTVEQALLSTGDDAEPRTVKFQRLILDRLFGIPYDEAYEYITDGGDDCGIDSFVIDNNNNQIHLISTKTVDAYEKAKKNFPGAEVTKLICFVRDFVRRTESLLTRCNPILRAKIIEAWDSIEGGRVFQICVHICSNQSELIGRDFQSLRESCAEVRAFAFEHHLTHLSDEVTRNWTPPTSKTLRFVGGELFEHEDSADELGSPVRSLVGSVRVTDLATFLRDERTGFVDESLFHANVRGHLGLQNPVNREIVGSLRSAANSRFFCLNNGVTIVCERYLYQSGGFPVTLHRPQIVNGRQTAEAIFGVHREDPARVAEVVVFVRIVQTSDPAFIEEVSVATNSQSRIGSRDLRANSSIAKKLAAGLSRLGFYYIRKRGERSSFPLERTIDALKAGQLIWAYVRGAPEKAKTDTSSMFGDEFESIFDPHLVTPELLVTAHRLFSDIEHEKRRVMLAMRQSGLSAASAEHWLVEGALHVLYCVSLLAKHRGLDISSYDTCSPLVSEAMVMVGSYYESVERVAAYRLFRSVRARDDLKHVLQGGNDFARIKSKQFKFDFTTCGVTIP